jgi:hypothetical protein
LLRCRHRSPPRFDVAVMVVGGGRQHAPPPT